MRSREAGILNSISMHTGDLPAEALHLALLAREIACDIETTGLDWRNERIRTCQVYIPGKRIYVVRVDNGAPARIGELLANPSIRKVFHHAMFDLRFMTYNWNFKSTNIACTKIASKLLSPETSHSLKSLLSHYLGLDIDKTLQTSDWSAPQLSEPQIDYAARDVLYLPELLEILQVDLARNALWRLTQNCFDFIPARVELDILGYEDIFSY